MAPRQFLILTADFKGEQPDVDLLVRQLDKALDWVRLTDNSWLLFTSNDPETWYTRFCKVSEDARVFITQIDASRRSGFMPKRVWEFIDQHKDEVRE